MGPQVAACGSPATAYRPPVSLRARVAAGKAPASRAALLIIFECPAFVLNRPLRPDRRYARRAARIARWDRPISGPLGRAGAWANMLLVDHGLLRLAYPNRAQVSAKLWRSSQPSPGQIRAFAAGGGRTVVNLRAGREYGSWPLQREACERHGLRLVEFVLRSREAPARDAVLSAKRLFDALDYPVLVHCKSGADRAGLFCALFLLIHEGASVAEARRQLSLRYGHFRFSKTGILDAFLDAYRREGEAKGVAFLDWADRIYDPDKVTRSFRPRFWSTLIGDRLIRRE